MLRRVRYRDPVTGTIYSFMTNLLDLPPGLIAFLYKLRWDIEKIFDEKKSKLMEKKAWAKSPIAKTQQANFVCLAHNLLVLFERCIGHKEGIWDEKVKQKMRKRIYSLDQQAHARGASLNPMVQGCSRITQRSLQFIRWLRHCLDSSTSWSNGINMLRPLMRAYL